MPRVLPKHVNHKQRSAISVALNAAGLTQSQIAYELRLHPTHLSGMLGGSKPMAYHYVPAIKFVLLQHGARAAQLARESLEPEITTPLTAPITI